MSELKGFVGEPITPREATIDYARNQRNDGVTLALLHIGDQLARIATALESAPVDGRTFRVSG